MPKNANHLQHEPSLYLQQHAHQPVDWYPWNDAALNLAKTSKKPILLSIGYSACHWCHRMAHESFEDATTAEFMNKHFINIKVDREERPDLDKIYQTAAEILTGKTGWPLTIFLTPEQVPFFAGNYFPLEPMGGRPGFKEVLQKVIDFYDNNSAALNQLTAKVKQSLEQLNLSPDSSVTISSEPLHIARHLLAQSFDHIHGGFGNAPKFPNTPQLQLLLNFARDPKQWDNEALAMISLTLTRMAEGGIYDQIGGGFFRYATDVAWMLPHFEKMLYENALLIPLYAQAYALTQNDLYKDIVLQINHWLFNEMQAPNGAYFATLNADSENEEGKFYFWDRNEIKVLLTPHEYEFCEQHFGLNLPANFNNNWHLYVADSLNSKNKILHSIRQKLFCQRDLRAHPSRDEKILTSWNALLIKGFIIASKNLKNKQLLTHAEKALEFIETHLWQNGTLYTSQQQNGVKINAYLDDYSFLLDALLCYLEVKWSTHYLNFAIDIAEKLIADFYDPTDGGFYFTANKHEPLIHRPKPFMDEATPSGNGVALTCLLRLGYLLGEPKYIAIVEKTLKFAWPRLANYPANHSTLLLTLTEYLNPPTFIILRGPKKNIQQWQQLFFPHQTPGYFCFAIADTEKNLPPALQKISAEKTAVAYICQGLECREMIKTEKEFKKYLDSI